MYNITKDPDFFAKTYFLEKIDNMMYRTNHSGLPIIFFDPKQGIITEHEKFLKMDINNNFEKAFIYCPRAFRIMLLEWYFINDLFPSNAQKRKSILATRADGENGFHNNDYDYIDFLQETATDKFSDIKELKEIIGETDSITIYRGVENKSLQLDEIWELDFPCLVSFTINKDVGEFFADRYKTGSGKLYKMEVRTSDIIAYDNSRKEQEVLICSEDVNNMQLIE